MEYDDRLSVHSKRLFVLHLLLPVIAAAEAVTRLILNATVLGDRRLYG